MKTDDIKKSVNCAIGLRVCEREWDTNIKFSEYLQHIFDIVNIKRNTINNILLRFCYHL